MSGGGGLTRTCARAAATLVRTRSGLALSLGAVGRVGAVGVLLLTKTDRSLSGVFIINQRRSLNKIKEQSCSNGEPKRHTGLWEEIRTTHKLSEPPMGHVPMGTTETWRCV